MKKTNPVNTKTATPTKKNGNPASIKRQKAHTSHPLHPRIKTVT